MPAMIVETGRVLHMVTAPVLGGAQGVAIALAKEQQSHGWKVFFATSPGGPLWQFLTPFEPIAVPMQGSLAFAEILRLRRWLIKNRIQIVHAHGARAAFVGALASLCTPVQLVVHVHLADSWRWNGSWKSRLDRLACKKASRIIACSEGLRDLLIHKQGLPAEKTLTILNGIDLDLHSSKKERPTGQELVVGSCVRLEEQKGLVYLLEAMAGLQSGWPRVRLVIAGDGSLRPSLEEHAKRLGLHVDWLGHRPDIPAVLATFDIFVLPSLVEGLPLSVLEAMACGLPVIGTKISGTAELIQPGYTGLLVQPASAMALQEALEFLLSHPAERLRLGANARESVQARHSFKEMGQKVRNLYARVLGWAD